MGKQRSIRRADCRYCKTTAHGYGCIFSPDQQHLERGDADHCILCGSTNYGYGCPFNDGERKGLGADIPKGMHVHGHGNKENGKIACIYCGKTDVTGYGCPFSPSGKHEF